MVAIVSGNSLGLSNTSATIIGADGLIGDPTTGSNNQQTVVNISNGNLILQEDDEYLEGQGEDIASTLTYNSQGVAYDEGNGPGWSLSMIKTVSGLTGTVDTAGSTILRTDGDGSQVVYTFNTATGYYVGREGSGAEDTLFYNSNSTWTWTDGSTGDTESYGSNGYITGAQDTSGNTLSYTYTGGLLTQVTDANGDSVIYTYSGGNLTEISEDVSGVTTGRVYYSYDSSNRLILVTTDLNPTGSTPGIDTGDTYWTQYTYQGSTDLIASITQKDGTTLNFSYDSSNRIHTVTDGLGNVTTYSYGTNQTTVQDPDGNVSTYTYDSEGRLTNVSSPTVDGVPENTSYTYDANGDLTDITDALGNTTSMEYDANGNLLQQVDALGDTITYTYNSANQVTSKTGYLNPAEGSTPASDPGTTYYLYDSHDNLVFEVSAAGRVTQNVYNYNVYSGSGAAGGSGDGDLISTIAYAGTFYNMTGLSTTNPPTLAQLTAWVTPGASGGADLTQSQRTDYSYNSRGQIATSTTYSSVNAQGTPSGASTSYYTYDPNGNLTQEIDGDGNSTSYTYDGLGRQLSSVDAAGSTSTSYNDAGHSITVTLANGLVTTSSYNTAGELTSTVQSGSTIATATTKYYYDADGNLLLTTDPDGENTYYLYDADGRQIAEIDATGQLTQTNYDADRNVSSTQTYTNLVDTASLLNSSGLPTNPSLASLVAGNFVASTNWNIYDAAGRLEYTIDALGNVTQTNYDGASNVVSTTEYATSLTTEQMATLGTSVTAAAFALMVPASTPQDRTTYYYYDADNLQIGEVDADGYFTQTTRNAAGQVTQTIQYATSTGAAGVDVTTSQTQETTGTAALDTSTVTTTQVATASDSASLNSSAVSTTETTTNNNTASLNSSLLSTTESTTNNNTASLTTGALTAGSSTLQTGTALNASGTALSAPIVVTDAAGNMTSAWIQDGHLMTREYSAATHSWSSVTQLDTAGGVQEYSLASSSDGHTIISWVSDVSSTYTVYAALGTTTGAWGSPVTVLANAATYSSATAGNTVLQSAIANGGVAAVGFLDAASPNGMAIAQFSNGAITGTIEPTGSSVQVMSMSIGIDSSGDILASWINTSGLYRIERYSAASGWGVLEGLTSSTFTTLASAVNSNGTGIVVYEQNNNLFAITYNPATNSFSPATQVNVSPAGSLSAASGDVSLAIDANGNAVVSFVAGSTPTVYAAILKGGAWQAPVALGTSSTGSTVSQIQPQVSINANNDVAVTWQSYSTSSSTWTAQVAYTVNGSWQSTVTADTSANESVAQVALDGGGNVQLVWIDKVSGSEVVSDARINKAAHYVIPSGATWASIATALYGTANAASALQTALGNPTLTAGNWLTQLPASLAYTTTTTTTVPAYYTIKSGDTWSSIATALYGTANVAGALQSALNNPTLTVGNTLTGFPSSLPYTTTTTTTVPAYYTVQSSDTWASIATTLYGTANAANALKNALNSPTLTAGLQLTGLPSTLPYTAAVAGSATLDSSAVSTTGAVTIANSATLNNSAVTTPTQTTTVSNPVSLNKSALSTTQITTTSSTASLNSSALTTGVAPLQAGGSLNTSGTTLNAPTLVTDAAGNMTSAWVQDGHLMTREYTIATNSWGSVTQLDTAGGVKEYSLETSSDGHTIISWVSEVGSTYSVYAALGTTTGGWNAPITVQASDSVYSNASPSNPMLQSAISTGGVAAVAFMNSASSDGISIAQFSNGTMTGIISPTSSSVKLKSSLNLGIDSSGDILLSYINSSSLYQIERYSATSGWGTLQAPSSGTYTSLASAMSANGTGIVVYEQSSNLYAITYNATTNTYSAATQINVSPATTLTETSGNFSVAMDSNGNAVVSFVAASTAVIFAAIWKGGVWQAPVAVSTTTAATSLSESSPQVSINSNDDIAIAWQAESTSTPTTWTAQVAYTVNGTWQSVVTADTSANESAAQVAIDGNGNVQMVWLDKVNGSAVVSDARINKGAYYLIPSGATWASIATALYGTSNAAAALQTALGNPALTTGNPLTNLPSSLSYTTSTSSTVPAYYAVKSGDTWATIAQTLYGTNAVASALQNALNSPTLSTGLELSGLPATLSYTTTVTTNLPSYYTVASSDTWATIAQTLYGTSAAASALQSALGSPTLSAGLQLTGLPTTLNYTTPASGSASINNSVLSTTNTVTTPYTVSLNSSVESTVQPVTSDNLAPLDAGALTTSAISQTGSALNTGGTTLSAPTVVTDAAGNMTSAWIQDGHLMTREYSAATQAWGSVTQVDTTGGVGQFNLETSSDGHTIISWVSEVGTTYTVYAALGTTTSAWTAPITVLANASGYGSTTPGNTVLQSAIANGGVAAVALLDADSSNGTGTARCRYRCLAPAGAERHPASLSAAAFVRGDCRNASLEQGAHRANTQAGAAQDAGKSVGAQGGRLTVLIKSAGNNSKLFANYNRSGDSDMVNKQSDAIDSQLNSVNEGLAVQPDNKELLARGIDYCIASKKLDAAQRYLDAATAYHSDDSFFEVRQASVFLAQGKPKEAERLLAKWYKQNGNTVIGFNLAQAYFMQNRFADASGLLGELILRGDCPASAVALLMQTMHRLGDLKAAIALAERHLKHGVQNAEFFGIAALLYFDDGQLDKARKMLIQSQAGAARVMEAIVVEAGIALGEGNLVRAKTCFEEALARNAGDGRSWMGLGLIHMSQNELDEASKKLERAIRFMPSFLGVRHLLGWCKLANEEVDLADEIFQEALKIDPNFGESHGAVAITAALKGERKRAEDEIRRALGLDPKSLSAQYAKMVLGGEVKDPKRFAEAAKRIMSRRENAFGSSLAEAASKFLRH